MNWLDKTQYPFASHYFSVKNYQLHYIDEGSGEPILFVHGTPSWSFDFRNVIKKLQSSHRCIAIDHIGFGLSEKPEKYDYSTQNHSQTLELFIKQKNLINITLVVHDFGGPIGLQMALRNPDRIKQIVVLNSWLWSNEHDPEFIKFSKILRSPLLPYLYRYLNFSPRFILPKSFGDHPISSKLLQQYTRPFANRRQRNGTVAFVHSLLNDQNWFEELWQQRHLLDPKPFLFIWGMKDPVISPKYLDKFRTGFKHTDCLQLFSAGHFPQEEQPEEVANAIAFFIKKNTP